jgi:hypothetical protein
MITAYGDNEEGRKLGALELITKPQGTMVPHR